MGNCSGSSPHVVSPPHVWSPPHLDSTDPSTSNRKQTYDQLKIILCESYDVVNKLQETFVSTNLYYCFISLLIKVSFHVFQFLIAFL